MKPKLLLVAAALALAVPAVASRFAPGDVEARPTRAEARSSYASTLRELDARVARLRARADERPGDWVVRMHLGAALLEKAGLTSRGEDFERVEKVLGEAFAIAPEGSGPLALAARFSFSVHRLDLAEHYLDLMDRRPAQRVEERLRSHLLRAEIALERGEYADAFDGLHAAFRASPAAATSQLALYYAKTGETAEAEALLEEALAAIGDDGRQAAWLEVQLGLLALERGSIDAAMRRFRSAEAAFPGWWVVEEQVAEIHHLRGDDGRATAMYESLVREHGLPQHMDALAGLYAHEGRKEEAERLVRKAGELWDEELARLPEAALGHGLHHVLQHGSAARALELAAANHALRPGGEAEVLLARAYLKAGRPHDALDVAGRALATPYRSAALHDVASLAHAALGDTEAAGEQRELALAANPWFNLRQHTH